MKLTNKDLVVLIKQAEDQGWNVTKRNNGHLKWVSPSGTIVYSAASPSDNRAIKNITRELRIRGFIVVKRK